MFTGMTYPTIKQFSSDSNLRQSGGPSPLPEDQTRRRVSASSLRSTNRPCRVPLCKNPSCTLRSHKLYDNSAQLARRKEAVSTPIPSSTLLEQEQSLSVRPKSISAAGVDALPTLPINGEDSRALRPLFHHFFDVVFDRLATLFRGPAVVTAEHKKRMLPVALSNTTYCLGLILQSHTDMVRTQEQFKETRESVYLYGKLINAFRHDIDKLSHTSDPYGIEIALLDLCILLAYDMLYDRKEFLWHHWSGLQRLVKAKGGIEAISTSLPYVVHVDRSCATVFACKPAFSKKREIVLQPESLNARYGTKFTLLNKNIGTLLSDDVLDYCKETARLLRTWEEVHNSTSAGMGDIDLSKAAATSAVYLHNCRDRLDERFSLVHSEMTGLPLGDQCCLLAARVVEYPITWANYYPVNNHKHCIHLCRALQTLNPSMDTDWQSDAAQNLLRWMLFAVLVAPIKAFKGRTWALITLKTLIEDVYEIDDWSSEESSRARSVEKMNLYGFVWCHSVLNGPFDRVWTELAKSV